MQLLLTLLVFSIERVLVLPQEFILSSVHEHVQKIQLQSPLDL